MKPLTVPWKETAEMVGPARAKELLAKPYTGQRKISQSRVNQWIVTMKLMKFRLSVDHICISPEGYLLNGRHRLTAIAQSSLEVPLAFLWDVPEDKFELMDRGRARSFADAYSVNRHAAVIAKAVFAANGVTSPTDCQTLTMLELLRHEIDALLAVPIKASARIYVSAPFRAAAVLRMHNADQRTKESVLELYEVLANGHTTNLPPYVRGFIDHLVKEPKKMIGHVWRKEGAVEGWRLFDPTLRHSKKKYSKRDLGKSKDDLQRKVKHLIEWTQKSSKLPLAA